MRPAIPEHLWELTLFESLPLPGARLARAAAVMVRLTGATHAVVDFTSALGEHASELRRRQGLPGRCELIVELLARVGELRWAEVFLFDSQTSADRYQRQDRAVDHLDVACGLLRCTQASILYLYSPSRALMLSAHARLGGRLVRRSVALIGVVD